MDLEYHSSRMEYGDTLTRLRAADKLWAEKSVSRATFESLRALIGGLNPKIDTLLSHASKELSRVEKIHRGEIIDLSLEQLPEITEPQKKRKRAILLFISTWKQLRAEVKRVQVELDSIRQHGHTNTAQLRGWARIAKFAKGPLGLITVAAVAIVALQSLSVSVVVKNQGCRSLQLSSVSIPLPGLRVPSEPILDGQSATVTLPPLPLTVDGTIAGTLRLSSIGFGRSFAMSGADIFFDGESLGGRKTSLQLGNRREHELVIRCSPNPRAF